MIFVFSIQEGHDLSCPYRGMEKEKGPEPKFGAFCEFIPAATYVPTQLPVQYHRPGEA